MIGTGLLAGAEFVVPLGDPDEDDLGLEDALGEAIVWCAAWRMDGYGYSCLTTRSRCHDHGWLCVAESMAVYTMSVDLVHIHTNIDKITRKNMTFVSLPVPVWL